MTLFSVVIPTFNRAAFIQRTLDSVLGQNFGDFETIVVDDGSTDGTVDLVRALGDRIRLVQQENRGPGAARNLGVKHSQGEYIAFLDSDDLWFPWTLSVYARLIAEQHRPTFLAGAIINFCDEAELSQQRESPISCTAFVDYYEAARLGLYCGSGHMAVRRDIFLEVGGFVEERFNAEDHDFVMRLGTQPGFVHVSAPAMVAWRQHPGSATRDLAKTFAGATYLLETERARRYPGGRLRRRARRSVLAQHMRSLSLQLVRQGELSKAWSLYRRTFGWNLALGRVRYLLGFPFHAARRLVST